MVFSSICLIVVTRKSNVLKFATKMVSISILWQVASENEIRGLNHELHLGCNLMVENLPFCRSIYYDMTILGSARIGFLI